jgi:hypothetical protein
MAPDPTLIGTVQDVNGSTVTVELSRETVTGLSFHRGDGYRIGQVGSFVRIPLGYTQLFGVVSQVGAGAAPIQEGDTRSFGNRWLKVQIVGEGVRSGRFQRGISQHPTIDDSVHLVTESDLRAIYGPGEPDDFVAVGRLASAESIPALVDVNKLITRHAAVVGSTGAGKSTTVAGLLASLTDPSRYPSARIVVLDIHGEYSRALEGLSTVFRIAADESKGERKLFIPFWALRFEELAALAMAGLEGQRAAAVGDHILQLKREAIRRFPKPGISEETVTVDTPVPFSLNQLWLDLHKREFLTVVPRPGGRDDERDPAYVLDDDQPIQVGDAAAVIPPLYRNVKTTGTAAERVNWAGTALNISQQVNGLASKLRDPRFEFLLKPGDWYPGLDGSTTHDLDQLLHNWIGGPQPITILDLSGIPTLVLDDLVGALLRILYDALFWSRNLEDGGRERPLLVVLEEAHAYLSKDSAGTAAAAVRRIAKEGRKYGVGMLLVSQRPSEIDQTILSQCGTIFAMRLTNDIDRGQVVAAASDNLKGLFDMLPVLRTGEAIIVGEAVSLPIRTLIDPPPRDRRPDSEDPRVAVRGSVSGDGFDAPGGWNQRRGPGDYEAMVKLWREQTPRYRRPAVPDEDVP